MTNQTDTEIVRCATCGRRGVVKWTGAPYSNSKSGAVLAELSEGFLAVDVGDAGGPKIICASCREVAVSEQVARSNMRS